MFQTTEMEINLGPQHPSTHGVLRVLLKVDGERILESKPVIGYLHRGCEKLGETRPMPQVVVYTDRMDYVAAFAGNLTYIEAVERLIGLEAPPRAKYMRVVLAELQRIASHLLWLGTHALDIGAMSVFLYCFREREMVLDLFEGYCGARLTLNAVRIGGQLNDFPDGWVDECRRFLNAFPKQIEEYETLLSQNRIWIERTRGVGIISAEEAIDWGLSGPPLRGSGVGWDIRKSNPYAAYADLSFDVPVGENGDTYDRYLVRMEEMRQARRLALEALDKMPGGDVRAKVPKRLKPPVGAEVYHATESPRGEMGVYLKSDGSETAYRCRFRSPSFVNLQALPTLAKGHLIADIVTLIGSIDIVLGCVDR
jgi:NADH-quinone oxidoreductase subunit D